jgi:hypothetical protein
MHLSMRLVSWAGFEPATFCASGSFWALNGEINVDWVAFREWLRVDMLSLMHRRFIVMLRSLVGCCVEIWLSLRVSADLREERFLGL